MSRTTIRLCTVTAALFLTAAPARSQQPLGQPVDQDPVACPSVEAGDGTPLELRIAGRLIRLQVGDGGGKEGDGAHLQMRLVGCDEADSDGATGPSGPGAGAGAPGEDTGSPLLRLIHDLRVGLELAPTEDGRCIRARVAVEDHAGAALKGGAAATPDEPVGVEICGLPFSLGGRTHRP